MPSCAGCLVMGNLMTGEIEPLKLEELEGLLSKEGTCVYFEKLERPGYTIFYGVAGADIILKRDLSPREKGITLVHEAIHVVRRLGSNCDNENMERMIDERAKDFYEANSQLVDRLIITLEEKSRGRR